MALQLWLPLNGNLNNQGLADVTISGSPTSWGAGRVTKSAASFTKAKANAITCNTTLFNYADDFTWCGWFKSTYDSSSASFLFTVGRADATDYGYGLQKASDSQAYIRFGSSVWTISSANDTWQHIAFTKSGNTISIYINGALSQVTTFSGTLPTYSNANGLGLGCFSYSGGKLYYATGSINDFRIYDNCLSPREVHEIAKGLAVHYPLNDPYCTGSLNKYSGEYAAGTKVNSYSTNSLTMTPLTDERGANFKLNYTGTGSNVWSNIKFPNCTFTAGKTYDYSCKIRVHSASNINLSFRAARMSNDWEATTKSVVNSNLADDKWCEYHIQQTLAATSTRSGTSYTTSPCIEFYTGNLSTSGTVYTADFDIKDIQFAETSSGAVPFNDGQLSDTVVYDTSGFGNHGTVVEGKLPTIVANSPRYECGYSFDGSSTYISSIANPINSTWKEFSISCWVKLDKIDATQTIYTARTDIGNGIGFFILASNYIRLDDNAQTTFSDYGITELKDVWTHVCVTRTATTKKLYINGTLVSTQSTSGTMGNIGVNGTIGASENSDSGIASSNLLDGSLSDFRLYATALSAADVAELYNAPITITNNGTLMTQGEFKEED